MSQIPTEPSLSEILRRLDELALEVKSMPLRFEEMFVLREVYKSEQRHVDDRINKLESRSEWIVRTVGGLVIALVFGVAIVIGQ
jgi:hypothetical protein